MSSRGLATASISYVLIGLRFCARSTEYAGKGANRRMARAGPQERLVVADFARLLRFVYGAARRRVQVHERCVAFCLPPLWPLSGLDRIYR